MWYILACPVLSSISRFARLRDKYTLSDTDLTDFNRSLTFSKYTEIASIPTSKETKLLKEKMTREIAPENHSNYVDRDSTLGETNNTSFHIKYTTIFYSVPRLRLEFPYFSHYLCIEYKLKRNSLLCESSVFKGASG